MVKKSKKVGPPRPAKFNPGRRPASPALSAAIEVAHESTEVLLRSRGRRTRGSSRADDSQVILADITHAAHLGRPGVAVSRDNTRQKHTRYGAPMSTTLSSQADLLTEAGWIEQDKGYRGFPGMAPGQLTVLRPTPKWLAAIAGTSLVDTFADHTKDELVMLKGTKLSDGEASDLVEYADTDTTNLLRSQMKAINLANAWHVRQGNVEFIGDALMSGYLVDVRDTFQQRYFNRGSFQSGGRIFGGWWKPMGGEERRRDVRLMGEPAVELDVAAMGLRLAYAHVGIAPPDGDLYGPRRFTRSIGDGMGAAVTLSRETIKTLTCAMLFDETAGRNRWPRGFEKAGRGVHVTTVMDGIKEMHAPIAHLFGTGFGHYGMFMESNIMIDTLLRLAAQAIPTLDVHESIMVADGHEAAARATFESTFECHTGMLPKINSKRADEFDCAEIAANF